MKFFFVICSAFLFLISSSCNYNKTNQEDISDDIVTDTTATVESISEEIRKNPKNHRLFAERAKLQFENRNIEEAVNDMKIALVLDSVNQDYYILLAEYSLNMGQSEKARGALLECLALNPHNVEARIKLAQIYFYIERYRDAMREILNLEENNLQNAESYFLKGLILYETEATQEAIQAFRRSIEFDRNFWQAHNFLGLIHSRLNNPLAVDYFDTAIELFPKNLEIRLNAGIVYQEFNLPEKALEQYKYILSVDSSVYNAYFNKGFVYLELLGDYANAIESFTKAIKLDSESYPAYYNRGFAYELSGNLNEAEKNYRKALEIMPNYDLAVDGLNEVIEKKRNI